MPKNIIYIISLLLTCCSKTSDLTNREKWIIYSDLVSGKYAGSSTEEIRSILGEPDNINHIKRSEVWNYGPSLEEAVSLEGGEVAGVMIYFDEEGRVSKVRAVKKTQRKGGP